jgi:sulfur-carrier protein
MATQSSGAQVLLKYFAWVRERVGRDHEVVDLPANILTIADLVVWLIERGPEYRHAFDNPAAVRAAVDQAHVKPNASIRGAREIAFFPPVTGG